MVWEQMTLQQKLDDLNSRLYVLNGGTGFSEKKLEKDLIQSSSFVKPAKPLSDKLKTYNKEKRGGDPFGSSTDNQPSQPETSLTSMLKERNKTKR